MCAKRDELQFRKGRSKWPLNNNVTIGTLTDVKDKVQYSPSVSTRQGVLRGKVVENPYNLQNYFAFLGVPYAEPPLKDLRFHSPKSPGTWQDVRDAIEERPGCYSRHPIFSTVVGDEDCLYLNVYTPEIPHNNTNFTPKPVMVYVHGGSFIQGSGSTELYGPDFLIAEDVIVVTFNYRVGLLGFLSLNDPSLKVPGNAGLKDIVMALKWIQENISNFGGDPQNVTIFGCSAGAGSIHHLIASPMGKGLFHKAVLQSGNLFCPWALAIGYAEKIKEELKINDEKHILEILKRLSTQEVLELQEKLKDTYGPYNQTLHGPVIENKNSMEEAFLSEHPLDIILSGKYNDVPLIIGYANREGLVYALYNKLADGTIRQIPDFERIVPCYLEFPSGSSESKQVANSIKTFYYGDEQPSMDNIDNLFLLLGDSHFLTGAIFTVRAHLRTSSHPIYLYRFSVDGRLNLYKKTSGLNFYGACHADEIGYLFKGILADKIIPNSKEDISVRRMTKLWTNFAKRGNPNPVEDDESIPVKWEEIAENTLNFLDIGENLTTGKNPDCARVSFWDDIYKQSPKLSPYIFYKPCTE